MDKLIALLCSFAPLSPGLEAHLRKKLQPLHYKKWDFLLKAGEVANHILFLEIGLVRSYSILMKTKRDRKTQRLKKVREEVSNWFMREGNIIISVESFLLRIAAEDWIQALEDCVCWGITHAELEETYRLFPEFERVGRLVTGVYYCKSEARHRSQRKQDSVEKYRYILDTEPDLLSRVQQRFLCSYLGMSRRTFQNMPKKFRGK
jgi:CRP-like cAMP-binding protein